MKIAIVQTDSYAGDIPKNIEKHLAFAQRAAEDGADLIVFPELSITGYEPTLAADLATQPDDPAFAPFQQLANAEEVIIAVGMPLKTEEKPQIGLGIFRPFSPPLAYAKMLLDPDEFPYFSAGDRPMIIRHKEHKIALAICYESQQESHLKEMIAEEITAYVASVALPDRSIEKSHFHYAAMAEKYDILIIVANSIGQHDIYTCGGHSAMWMSGIKVDLEEHTTDEVTLLWDIDKLWGMTF